MPFKRKNSSSQPSISKFFKPSLEKEKRNPTECHKDVKAKAHEELLQEKLESHSNQILLGKLSSNSSDNENGAVVAKTVFNAIQRSMQKIKRFDVNSTYCAPVNFADIEPISDSSSSNEQNINTGKSYTKVSKRVTYTPLEQQFVAIKEKNKDVLLFVECGYKYRFFGEDAEIASKELNIYCHMDHNFLTASIPVHRLNVHICRLVEKGYKVGVVRQTETAALKAVGDNKNAPFTRKLTDVYTKATLIENEGLNISPAITTGHYIAAIDIQIEEDHHLVVSLLLVNPATGDVVYDILADEKSVTANLMAKFQVLRPCELIVDKDMKDKKLRKFLDDYRTQATIRLDNVNKVAANDPRLTQLCERINSSDKISICALLGCIKLMMSYLDEFSLGTILMAVDNYRPFAPKDLCMKLNDSSIKNLELFENNVYKNVENSVFWILDHTVTMFGKRLLKCWLSEPLLDQMKINERLEAVSELKENLESRSMASIKLKLKSTIDLERALASIYYRKISPGKFIKLIEQLENMRVLFLDCFEEISRLFSSKLFLTLIRELPDILGSRLVECVKELNKDEAAKGSKERLFKNLEKFPELNNCHERIKEIETSLYDHLKNHIRPTLRDWKAEYKTVANTEYVIEVKNTNLKVVPKEWIKVMATKQVSRFRTPNMESDYKELCRSREKLRSAGEDAWISFLDDFLQHYNVCRQAVKIIASVDCLLSLAVVAKLPGYCKPNFEENFNGIKIIEGRHPVIENLMGESEQYVANSTYLSNDQKIMLVSGPNMGGKSSYIKQVAVICILAQIGSYVPAGEARLSVVDAVYTRMGGSDDIKRGKSTFMVELEEASFIMREASDKSLVIMDELGRGTSTHDGTAIAFATLNYFIDTVKSFTLFVTHYPMLADFERTSKGYVKNSHLAFMSLSDVPQSNGLNDDEDCIASIVFLYQLSDGAAKGSYGLNVARLANLPQVILSKASKKSREFEKKMHTHARAIELFRGIFKCEKNISWKKKLLSELKTLKD